VSVNKAEGQDRSGYPEPDYAKDRVLKTPMDAEQRCNSFGILW
jgi:hypothetical protein